MHGKQRENSGKTAGIGPEQRENSGKTAGIGAQTAGIWKTLENPFSDTNCPKIAKFRYFTVFFANFGWNSRFEA